MGANGFEEAEGLAVAGRGRCKWIFDIANSVTLTSFDLEAGQGGARNTSGSAWAEFESDRERDVRFIM